MQTLLLPIVHHALTTHDVKFREIACDAALADTAAFCAEYGYTPEQSANTILVASRKVEPVQYAACVVLATHRLDVNKSVCREMGVKRASFADFETSAQLTGMESGGVVAVGITDMPILIDADVMQVPEVVMGGGNRTSKIILDPHELLKLPNARVVEGLAAKKDA